MQRKRKRPPSKVRTSPSPAVDTETTAELRAEPPSSAESPSLAELPSSAEPPSSAGLPSPTKEWYRKKAKKSTEKLKRLQRKIKTLQQSKRRLVKRCDASQHLVEELNDRKLLSEKGLEVFKASFLPEIQELLTRAHDKTNVKFPPQLRAFALILHYYSPPAYDYVRSKFNNLSNG